jgi:hypothetical protein
MLRGRRHSISRMGRLSPPTSRHVNSLRIVLPNGNPDRKWTPALHQCFHASVQFRIQRLSREPFCKNRQRDEWQRSKANSRSGRLGFTNSRRWPVRTHSRSAGSRAVRIRLRPSAPAGSPGSVLCRRGAYAQGGGTRGFRRSHGFAGEVQQPVVVADVLLMPGGFTKRRPAPPTCFSLLVRPLRHPLPFP